MLSEASFPRVRCKGASGSICTFGQCGGSREYSVFETFCVLRDISRKVPSRCMCHFGQLSIVSSDLPRLRLPLSRGAAASHKNNFCDPIIGRKGDTFLAENDKSARFTRQRSLGGLGSCLQADTALLRHGIHLTPKTTTVWRRSDRFTGPKDNQVPWADHILLVRRVCRPVQSTTGLPFPSGSSTGRDQLSEHNAISNDRAYPASITVED